MEFIEKQKKIENIIQKYNDIIGNESKILISELDIKTSEYNQKAIEKIENENRLLQLGIVGRVKAGKSSLLNALLFDGKTVLPKAATPMTAALTIISYGENLSAEVELFTQDDINNIKREHSEYIETKNRLVEKKIIELKEKRKKKKQKIVNFKLSKEELAEIKQKAIKRVERELKERVSLTASFEQYEKIKVSSVKIEDIITQGATNIVAPSLPELSKELINYVGADGKFMPFTKSVHIKIPDEKLKDIQIVDTPGVNDPVRSREERTRELLKYCDAILIVSPSGQFINQDDIELMDRITAKAGVRELYVVASQVDTQLLGSIKRDSNGDLHNALGLIVEQLSQQLNDSLVKLKNNSPEVGNSYDQLIEQSSNRVIHSSGISQTIISLWNKRNEWDSGTLTVWNNLTTHYPDYFSDNNMDISISNLKKMANTDIVNNNINYVREQKNEILQNHKKDFLKAKSNAINEYQEKLLLCIDVKLREITETDIEELKLKKKKLNEIKTDASILLDENYDFSIENVEIKLKDNLTKKLNSYFKEAKNNVSNAEGSETESWEVSESHWYNPFSWGKKHTNTRSYVTVRAGAVRNSLEDLTSNIEDSIDIEAKNIIMSWRKSTPNSLIGAIRETIDDDYLNINRIKQAFRKVFGNIIFPELSYSEGLPKNLRKSGTLEESDAEEFISEAQNYIRNLRSRVRKDIKLFISKFSSELKSINMSEEFFDEYNESLEELAQQIQTKELTISNFTTLKRNLSDV